MLEVVGILRDPGDVVSRDNDIDLNFLTPAFADESYGDEVGLFSVGSLVAAEPGTSLSEARDEASGGALPGRVRRRSSAAGTLRRQAAPTLDAMATGLRIVALVLALVGGTAIVLSLVRDVAERLGEHEALARAGSRRSGASWPTSAWPARWPPSSGGARAAP